MSNGKVSVNWNPGWLGLLGVIFVVAKVFQIGPVAQWDWWLVLLPFYIGLAIFSLILLSGAGLYGLLVVADNLRWKYRHYKRRKEYEKKQVWDALNKK